MRLQGLGTDRNHTTSFLFPRSSFEKKFQIVGSYFVWRNNIVPRSEKF
jgi:hypothetical protein